MTNRTWLYIGIYLSAFFVLHSQIGAAQSISPELIEAVRSSVVTLITYDADGTPLKQGSGFFVSDGGGLITSRHVLVGATYAVAKGSGDKEYVAEVVATDDKAGDLITLSAQRSDGTPTFRSVAAIRHEVRTGRSPSAWPSRGLSVSSETARVGEPIIVVGSPLGLDQTISSGIVSAIRDLQGVGKVIQITAPVSPGSSGGPVVNVRGEVIGVVTSQITEGQNLNFAIPAERIFLQERQLEPRPYLTRWNSDAAATAADRALDAYERKDFEAALKESDEALEHVPGWPAALVRKAAAYEALDRYEEAVETYRVLAARSVGFDPYVTRRLAWAYTELNDHGRAFEAFRTLAEENPEDFNAQFELGMACSEWLDQGASTQAPTCLETSITALTRAVRLRPENPDAHLALGILYARSGRTVDAFRQYRILVERNSECLGSSNCAAILSDFLQR